MPNVSFMAPGSELELAQQDAVRQRALADALRQQSMTSAQGVQAGNMYVAPSWTQGLAKLLQGYTAGKLGEKVDGDLRTARSNYDTRTQKEVQDFVGNLRGTPAVAATPEVQGNNPSAYAPEQAGQAAVAPDMNKAMMTALSSQNPMIQGMGSGILNSQVQSDMMQQRLAAALRQVGITPPAGGAAGAPGGVGGAGGSIGGVNPLAFALTASGDPTMGKLGGMVADASKPIALREGDLVVPDGNGGAKTIYTNPKMDPNMQPVRDAGGRVTGMRAIPGAVDAVGEIEGAKQDQKASRDMITIDTPQGTRMVTRQQAAQAASGTQPRSANPMAPQPGDSDRALIYSGEMKAAQARLDAAKTPEERTRAQSDLDSLNREVKAQGIQLQDDTSKKFGQQVATQSADALIAGRDKAKAASDDLMNIVEARKSIKGGVFAGSGADTKLAIAKFVNANIPGVNIDAAKVGNTDYLKSTLGSGLLAQAKTLGANPSNADAERINDIVGSIGKDPEAMQKILNWRESMANRAIGNHNATVDDAEKRGMKSPYDLRVKAASQGVSNPLGIDPAAIDAELARRQQGRK